MELGCGVAFGLRLPSLICLLYSRASVKRQVWESHEVTHFKATYFLAYLSMSHLDGQLPVYWSPRAILMESHTRRVGSSLWSPRI